jgi:hypothetical protein
MINLLMFNLRPIQLLQNSYRTERTYDKFSTFKTFAFVKKKKNCDAIFYKIFFFFSLSMSKILYFVLRVIFLLIRVKQNFETSILYSSCFVHCWLYLLTYIIF